jgi:CRISPR-associated protein Csb2
MMPTQFVVSICFLDAVPSFHGRSVGFEPEWPPSPLRLFQAIVRAAAARWPGRAFFDYATPSLQWLEGQTPDVITPAVLSDRTPFRMYVPNNAGDLVAAAWARGSLETGIAEHRVEKDVRPTRLIDGDSVHFLFPLPDGNCPHLDVLCAAARSITQLGWGVDMVAGNASILSEEEAAKLPGERWRSSEDSSATSLRVPVEGTLDALLKKHEAFLNRIGPDGFTPVPPLSRFRVIGYRRATDPVSRPSTVFQLRNDDGSFFRYPQDKLIHLTGMVRHLAIALMKQSPPPDIDEPEKWVETCVAGHRDPEAKEHRQFSYLPLPSIGHGHADPAVRRIMIVAPAGGGRQLNHLTRLLAGQQLQPTSRTMLDHPPTLVRVHTDNVARFYTQPANAWASVTPVILPGHTDHKPDKTCRLIEAALRQSGVEQPCEFEWSPFSQFPKSLSAHKYDRDKRPAGYIRPDHLLNNTAVHLKLRFNEGLNVPGPLSIGSGRHCGLGLMAGYD